MSVLPVVGQRLLVKCQRMIRSTNEAMVGSVLVYDRSKSMVFTVPREFAKELNATFDRHEGIEAVKMFAEVYLWTDGKVEGNWFTLQINDGQMYVVFTGRMIPVEEWPEW